MKLKKVGFAILAASSMLLLTATDSYAMPNFARQVGADCALCHTQVPRLNRIGYEFRLAGYRMPDEIGKPQKFDLGNLFAARIQEQFNSQKHTDVTSSKNYTNNRLEFYEATLYPMTGSWGTNFGSLVELSMAPGDTFEVENAYVRGAWGDANGWFHTKVGVMHPWEGFGGSDRPLGNIRPLFQKMISGAQQGDGGATKAASGSPFYLWNLDESAIEVGYHLAKTGTSIAGRISNGLVWNPDAPNFVDPAQGGGLSKGKTDPGHNNVNYQLFVNQFLNDDSAVSFYYYNGKMPYAMPGEITAGSNPLVKFDRWAVYGNYQVLPKLNLQAGYAGGSDKVDNGAVAALAAANPGVGLFAANKLGKSKGSFLEAAYQVTQKLACGARYDSFDPSDTVNHNTVKAQTLTANWSIYQGLQLIADYQHKTTEQSAGGSNKDDQLLIRGIIIF